MDTRDKTNRESPRILANRIFLAPKRKENAIRVDSRLFAVGFLMRPHSVTLHLNWIHTNPA